MDDRVTAIKDRLARPSGGMNMDVVVLAIFGVDAVIILTVVAALSPLQAAWVVPIVVLAPFVIFWLLTALLWKPLERRYPPAPQSRDAVVKLGQSVQLGALVRFNNAVALAADEDHLHLIPFLPMRWAGAKVISVPWSRVTDVAPPPGRFAMRLTKAKVDGRTLAAPEWAISFARVGDAPEPVVDDVQHEQPV
jgi:hypothetical protein